MAAVEAELVFYGRHFSREQQQERTTACLKTCPMDIEENHLCLTSKETAEETHEVVVLSTTV